MSDTLKHSFTEICALVSNQLRYFPTIDDALRRAILRGVRVRILAAALHYPEICIRFLLSLASLNSVIAGAAIEVVSLKSVSHKIIDSFVVMASRCYI